MLRSEFIPQGRVRDEPDADEPTLARTAHGLARTPYASAYGLRGVRFSVLSFQRVLDCRFDGFIGIKNLAITAASPGAFSD